MHHLTHLRFAVALGVWVVLLFLFLLGGNFWLPRERRTRTLRVAASLVLTASLAVGFLLMPGFPTLGGGVLVGACGMVLISSVRQAPH